MDAFYSNLSHSATSSYFTAPDFGSNGNTGIVGTYDGIGEYAGLFFTTNYGETWTASNINVGNFKHIAMSGTYGVAAGLGVAPEAQRTKLYYSTDSGETWSLSNIVNADDLTTVILNGLNGVAAIGGPNLYYSGMYYTTDGGQTWTQCVFNMLFISVAMDGLNGVAVSQFNGLYYTTDEGKTWNQSNLNTTAFLTKAYGNNQSFNQVVISGLNAMVGTSGDGVFYSSDAGKTWYQSSFIQDLGLADIVSLALSGMNGIAGTYNAWRGLFYTTDAGRTWYQSNIVSEQFTTLTLDGLNGLAGCFSGFGAYYTTNGGETWTKTSIAQGRPGTEVNIYSVHLNGSVGLIGASGFGAYYINVVIDLSSEYNKTTTSEPFQLTPASNSPAEFLYSSSNNAVATVDSNGLVTILSGGVVDITVSQPALSNYFASSAVTRLFVSGGSLVNTVINAPSNISKIFGADPFYITPTSNNPNPYLFSSSDPDIASVNSKGMVTLMQNGNVTITVTQEPITGYYTAGVHTITVSASTVTTVIDVSPTFYKILTDDVFSLSVSTNSPAPITYSTSDPYIASVEPASGIVTVVGNGIATITITQNAIAGYTSDTTTTQINVGQTVIGAPATINSIYGDIAFSLKQLCNSNSSEPFAFSSSNPSVATIDADGIVTILGVGQTNITINQQSSLYYSAGTATTVINVEKQTTIIGVNASYTIPVTEQPFNLRAESNSPVELIYTSSNTNVATVDVEGVVTPVSEGSTTITISQVANINYTAGTTTTSILVIP